MVAQLEAIVQGDDSGAGTKPLDVVIRRFNADEQISKEVIVRNFRVSCLLKKFSDSRARFIRFAIVGATGIVVNLGAMTCLILVGNIKDWRASALATCIAMLNNYLLNNLWTFRDRAHRGQRLVTGYLRYVSFSLVGMGLTTATYTLLSASLARNLHQPVTAMPYPLLLVSQMGGVAVGTISNYFLNKTFTWR